MMHKIIKSRLGFIVGVNQDDRMWRYSKEFSYHLYVFEETKTRNRYKKDNFFRAHQLFGMFNTTLRVKKGSHDFVVFVFRRNQAIFLKILDLQNMSK